MILVVNDTLRADHLGIGGYNQETSPFTDSFFGQESLNFEQASSNAPYTLPSFASFFTSRYPSDIRMETYPDQLDSSIPSFPTVLNENGIKIAAFHASNVIFPLHTNPWGIMERFPESSRTESEDPLMFDVASDWIKRQNQDTPFFVLVHNTIAHAPYDPPPGYRNLFGALPPYLGPITSRYLYDVSLRPGGATAAEKTRIIRQYDQSVRYLDDTFKKFIESLPQSTLRRTVIIFTADHGEGMGEHKLFSHANSVYQELLHVPLLVHIPGIQGVKTSRPVSLLDLGPTILDVYGIPKPPSFKGNSLLGLADKLPQAPEIIRAELAKYIGGRDTSGSNGIKPQVRQKPLPDLGWTAARQGDWKLIQDQNSGLELYNLRDDPRESSNLIKNVWSLPEEQLRIVKNLADFLQINLSN